MMSFSGKVGGWGVGCGVVGFAGIRQGCRLALQSLGDQARDGQCRGHGVGAEAEVGRSLLFSVGRSLPPFM